MKESIKMDIPNWMFDRLNELAGISGKTIEDVVLYFFAKEVVHTRRCDLAGLED